MGGSNLFMRSQYLIATEKESLKGLPAIPFDNEMTWAGMTVLTDTALPVSRAITEKLDILVLGLLLHHEHPEYTDQDLVSLVAAQSATTDDAVRLLQECGGRYVALIQDELRTIAITDACAMRQLYWFGNKRNLVLSSSPRLILDALGRQPILEEHVAALLRSEAFLAEEHSWFGDTWYDDRISKLLANHCLDLHTAQAHRSKYFYDGPAAREEIVPYAANILTGLIEAAHSRYSITQPLTAGYDSRLLLAASKRFSDKTRYYLFAGDGDLNCCPDIRVATKLAEQLNLNFEVILPGKLRDDFAVHLKKKCFFPRVLPKSAHIQWHYDTNRGRTLNINGNCAEVGRHYKRTAYDRKKELIDYSGFNGFFAPQIQAWYGGAAEYSRTTGIPLFALFYWEQRMSNWGALFPFEQDMAIDEFTPYNHKNLLHALLKVDVRMRRPPRFQLFRDMMDHLWPETLSLPFNPIVGWNIKSRIRRIFMG